MTTRTKALEIAAKVRAELQNIYGDRLRGVYLFGSCARGEGGEDSDVDIAIVLDHVADRFAERERTSDLFTDLSLAEGIFVSRVFIAEEDFRRSHNALYQAIRTEGVPV